MELRTNGGIFRSFGGRLGFGSSALGRFETGIIDTQIMLGRFIALASGAAEPAHRFLNILFNAPAGFVTEAEITLRRSAFLLGSEPIPLDRFLVILRDDLPILI